MPFKTKREKVAAAQRRLTFSDVKQINYASDGKRELEEVFVEKKDLKRKRIEENYGYVRSDIVKIIIAFLAIITVQIILMVFIRTG